MQEQKLTEERSREQKQQHWLVDDSFVRVPVDQKQVTPPEVKSIQSLRHDALAQRAFIDSHYLRYGQRYQQAAYLLADHEPEFAEPNRSAIKTATDSAYAKFRAEINTIDNARDRASSLIGQSSDGQLKFYSEYNKNIRLLSLKYPRKTQLSPPERRTAKHKSEQKKKFFDYYKKVARHYVSLKNETEKQSFLAVELSHLNNTEQNLLTMALKQVALEAFHHRLEKVLLQEYRGKLGSTQQNNLLLVSAFVKMVSSIFSGVFLSLNMQNFIKLLSVRFFSQAIIARRLTKARDIVIAREAPPVIETVREIRNQKGKKLIKRAEKLPFHSKGLKDSLKTVSVYPDDPVLVRALSDENNPIQSSLSSSLRGVGGLSNAQVHSITVTVPVKKPKKAKEEKEEKEEKEIKEDTLRELRVYSAGVLFPYDVQDDQLAQRLTDENLRAMLYHLFKQEIISRAGLLSALDDGSELTIPISLTTFLTPMYLEAMSPHTDNNGRFVEKVAAAASTVMKELATEVFDVDVSGKKMKIKLALTYTNYAVNDSKDWKIADARHAENQAAEEQMHRSYADWIERFRNKSDSVLLSREKNALTELIKYLRNEQSDYDQKGKAKKIDPTRKEIESIESNLMYTDDFSAIFPSRQHQFDMAMVLMMNRMIKDVRRYQASSTDNPRIPAWYKELAQRGDVDRYLAVLRSGLFAITTCKSSRDRRGFMTEGLAALMENPMLIRYPIDFMKAVMKQVNDGHALRAGDGVLKTAEVIGKDDDNAGRLSDFMGTAPAITRPLAKNLKPSANAKQLAAQWEQPSQSPPSGVAKQGMFRSSVNEEGVTGQEDKLTESQQTVRVST